ncbi:MAG TPA: bifunctional YncE family protein/alkaline phosphatase family protein [Rhizomicrobium sp.]|jgi:DNA-binding beta-propeller fold protein YncE
MIRLSDSLMIGALVLASSLAAAETPAPQRHVDLPTGKAISVPVPGFVARTNSFPSRVAISPDGNFAAVLNQGYGTEQSGLTQSIGVLDLHANTYREFPDSRLKADEKSTLQSYFVGLAFSRDGKHLYASLSSTSKSGIAVYGFADGAVIPERIMDIPAQPLAPGKVRSYALENQPANIAASYPAGIALVPSRAGEQLLVANNLADNVVLVDVATGRILKSFDLATESRFVPREYPYSVIVNRSGTKAWVSEWNDSAVAELDLAGGTVARRLLLPHHAEPGEGGHATSLLLSPDERVLYVAVSKATIAASDGVTAFDLRSGLAAMNYHIGLGSGGDVGAATIGLAQSKDGSRLFATAASLNAVAVFDTHKQATANSHDALPAGFIPTEWYPTALAVTGDDILIASAKGEGAGPNNMHALVQSGLHQNPHPYIATLIGGSLQRLSLAGIDKDLRAYTRTVEDDDLLHSDPGTLRFAGGANPIRHVIYILKENRTYDQIFGDLPAGNGDPSLVMFGADVTPNEHRLALQFGVLDNFYDSGDVSANGHLWSDGADTSDYMENVWPVLYRGSERPEDFGNPLQQGVPDPGDPGTGFIWDNVAAHGMSYRIYGEMADTTWCRDLHANSPREGTPSAQSGVCTSDDIKQGGVVPAELNDPAGTASPWPWPVPLFKEIRPTRAAQRGHLDSLYADFELTYPDQYRADEFLREFRQFVSARGSAQELPALSFLWLPNDHTAGTKPGLPSPRASVADNDLALGRIVEAVSQSPYWDDTAIFVLEDDAQNGSDHVDAHRSTALVISKYAPKGPKPFVDHRFYTTVSMIHTAEELLGLPAMNLFDTHAPVFAPLFAGAGDQPPFQADDRNRQNGLLYEANKANAPGAKKSAELDFSHADAADAEVLNEILREDAAAIRSAKSVSAK